MKKTYFKRIVLLSALVLSVSATAAYSDETKPNDIANPTATQQSGLNTEQALSSSTSVDKNADHTDSAAVSEHGGSEQTQQTPQASDASESTAEVKPNTTPAGDDTTVKTSTEANNRAAAVQTQEPTSNTNSQTPSVTTAAGENEQEITSITPEEYEANVANINKVSMADVYQMFTQDGKEHTLYLGRPTCPYCRRFSPEVKKFNDLIGGQLDYFNTASPEYDDAARNFMRNTVGVPGVPAVLYIKNGKLVSGVADSTLTAQDVYKRLYVDPQQQNMDPATPSVDPALTNGNRNSQLQEPTDPNPALVAAQTAPSLQSGQHNVSPTAAQSTANKLPQTGQAKSYLSLYGYFTLLLAAITGIVMRKRTH